MLASVLIPLTACALVISPAATAAAPAAHSAAKKVTWKHPAVTSKPMSAADTAALQKDANDLIADWSGSVPGVWIGVWDPTKGWAIVSAGNAQVGGAAATTADHSRIGSVTKTFVATEILKLVDAGKLGLNDTLGSLMPSLAKKYSYIKNVTVAKMLGMRSGIPDYTDVPGVMIDAYTHPEKNWTAAQLINIGLASATKLGEPNYSNTNYLLLGEIAKQITGKSIFSLVNANVAKLKMKQTKLPVPGQNTMPAPFSHGYTYAMGSASLQAAGLDVPIGDEQKDDVTKWGQAAGSMYSTVADLGKWAATGLGTSQLSPALAKKRLDVKPISGGFIQYGYGMESFGGNWIGHDGQAIGWESRVAYNTKTGAAIVILVSETGSLGTVLKYVQDYTSGMTS